VRYSCAILEGASWSDSPSTSQSVQRPALGMFVVIVALGIVVFVGLFVAGLRRLPWWTPFALGAVMANLTIVILPLTYDHVEWPVEVYRLTFALGLYVLTYWSGRGAARMMGPPSNPARGNADADDRLR